MSGPAPHATSGSDQPHRRPCEGRYSRTPLAASTATQIPSALLGYGRRSARAPIAFVVEHGLLSRFRSWERPLQRNHWEVPMATREDVKTWRGRTLVDRDGDKIGKIEDIYLDRSSGEPEWVAVKTGLFGSNV